MPAFSDNSVKAGEHWRAICELDLAESRRIQGLSSGRPRLTLEATKTSAVPRWWSMLEYPDKDKTNVLLPRRWISYLSSKSFQELVEGVVYGNGISRRTGDCQATIQADGGFIADEIPVHLQTGVGLVSIDRIEGRGMVALGALG
ncbi:hypothetical protein An07g03490 [Aspergillus niger]|uniref:Uncharacterized protein n=2 Tax=Aspergillus niger TaxID=5061 RepID=A2QMV9_ASPNC|nr:hypothetical protein An07g03490 [Aspergillus niger]CAL00283.1 hypothetical protein An07g03490 [Aspergillus niger]